jgi:hypothetical protein
VAWRVAQSLEVLRDQINAAYPLRSRASDGTIGDAAHQASVSDHNPDRYGVVRALDITHDPAHGCDIDQLSDALCASRDERISYLIANRLITGPNYGWAWCAYDGDDPHTNHLHLSVVGDWRADDTRAWAIGASGATTPEGGKNVIVYRCDKSYVVVSGDRVLFRNWGAIEPHIKAGVQVVELSAADFAAVNALQNASAAPAAQLSLTDAQANMIGAAAASAAGARITALEAKVDRLIAAAVAAGDAVDGAAA